MKISETRQRRIFELIEKQKESDLGVAEFCRRHRLKKWTFWYWRKKLAETESSKATRSNMVKDKTPAFYPVSCSPLERTYLVEDIEIRYPSGIQVKFPSSFDIVKLKQFILSTAS